MVQMPHWPKPVGLLQNETSLQRMQEVLARLGNPHLHLPPTVHVAGTNGKGSTIAFLKAMLEAAGKSVHCYNTPHLMEFNERITLAGRHISDDYLFEIMEETRHAAEGLPLGFYEATTAGALLAFSKIKADYLLLETGLGGRLDATNIIPAPLIAVLTTIAKDHVEFLGDDVRHIAIQKLAIVKPGAKCISSLQYEAVDMIIGSYCVTNDIPILAFGHDFGVEKTESGFTYFAENLSLELPEPALAGDHQLANASAAITAALELGVAHEHISEGIKTAKWPSRLEKIEKAYVPEGWELWLDGAHNPAGAFALANHLDYWKDKPVYLIFGTTRGREVGEFLAKFRTKAQHLALSKIKFEPASYEAEDMQEVAEALGFEPSLHDNLQEAIQFITTKKAAGRILACGSLFMRGDL